MSAVSLFSGSFRQNMNIIPGCLAEPPQNYTGVPPSINLRMMHAAIKFFSSMEKEAVAALGHERVVVIRDMGQAEKSIMSHFFALKPTKNIGTAMGNTIACA